jgi:hypothetical protein
VKVIECPREHDVVTAVTSGRWLDASSSELREHATGCATCREVAEVAAAFTADRAAAFESAPVPSAAHVWWRAQMRARQEAARTVSAPLNVVQAFAAAAAIGLVAAILMAAWPATAWTPSSVEDLVSGWASGAVGAVRAIAFASPRSTVVFATIVACLVLMPIGVYFALSENESDASHPEP